MSMMAVYPALADVGDTFTAVTEEGVEMTFVVDEKLDADQEMMDNLRSGDTDWTLEIYCVSTGRRMVSNQVSGNNGVSYLKSFRK